LLQWKSKLENIELKRGKYPPPLFLLQIFFATQAQLNALLAHSGDSLSAVTDSDTHGVAPLKGCDAPQKEEWYAKWRNWTLTPGLCTGGAVVPTWYMMN